MTCQQAVSLGAYLLGAMEPPDRYALEYHLGSCGSCRTELVRLAPLPGLLHQLTPGEFENLMEENTGPFSNPMLPNPLPQGPMPSTFDVPTARAPDPPDLPTMPERVFDPAFLLQEMGRPWPGDEQSDRPSDRLAASLRDRLRASGHQPGPWPAEEPDEDRQIEGTRSSRRPWWGWLRGRWLTGITVVLVLVVGIGLGLATVAGDDQVSPGTSVTWTSTDAQTGVRASAELTGRSWGTELRLRLENVPTRRCICNLVVKGQGGVIEIAGRWSSGLDTQLVADIPASTSVAIEQIEHLEVITNSGVLVSLTSPP